MGCVLAVVKISTNVMNKKDPKASFIISSIITYQLADMITGLSISPRPNQAKNPPKKEPTSYPIIYNGQ